jgi:hypothetical protein
VSDLDDFLLGGNDEVDDTFGVETMTCLGQSFAVVMNDRRQSFEGALGGLETDIQATATAQPRNVDNPRAMLQKRCTIAGEAFRVAEVVVGPVAVHFTLVDPSDSR